MKKLMIAVAAVACATVGLADDITSANTVGYTGKDAEQGKFMILGAQFEHAGTGSLDLNGLLTGLVGVSVDEANFKLLAPQVQLPNAQGSGYTIYYYASDGWYEESPDNWKQKAGWCDDWGNIVELPYTAGEAMWVKSIQTPTAANVAGQVPDDATGSIDCPQGFALRANIYPIAITLNDANMTVNGLTGADIEDASYKTVAPQIQLVDATVGYTIYYYAKNGWYEESPDNWKQKAGWCDDWGTIVTDVVIPVAQGFWTKGVEGEFSLEFKGIQ